MEVVRNIPDAELVDNLRRGNRMDEMIRALYQDCFESLAWYIMNNSGNRQDAEDIFQEVVVSFIDLVQKDRFRGESGVKTFLFSINRHLWLNELKRRGRAIVREEKYEKARDQEQADVSAVITGKEAGSELVKLVSLLGETCRKILLLFYYENRSMKEILDTLDYENEQVVRNKKSKCLKQLGKMIEENPAVKQTLKTLLHG